MAAAATVTKLDAAHTSMEDESSANTTTSGTDDLVVLTPHKRQPQRAASLGRPAALRQEVLQAEPGSDALLAQQFIALKFMLGVNDEWGLRRLPPGMILEAACAMFRMLSTNNTAIGAGTPRAVVKGQRADPPLGSPTAIGSGATRAVIPSQSIRMEASHSNSISGFFVPDAAGGTAVEKRAERDVTTEAATMDGAGASDSNYSSVTSTPHSKAMAPLPNMPKIGTSLSGGGGDGGANSADYEIYRLTEDALRQLGGDMPSVLVSGLIPVDEDGHESSDEVSDTRMSVSRTDLQDDGIFEGVNDYILIDQIGRGQTGKVMKAVDTRSNNTVAIKVIPRHLVVEGKTKSGGATTSMSLAVPSGYNAPTSSQTTKFKKEVLIMKQLKHRNIARLLEVIDDEPEQQVFLVMPLLPGGPILAFDDKRHCERLSSDVARRHLVNIVAGLQYLKKHRIVHRDLKPDNIILSDKGVATLVDFGQSEWAHDPFDVPADDPNAAHDSGSDGDGPVTRVRNLGTPAFMAPEVIQGCKPDFPSDVWSLGVILYAMLYGRLPFRGAYAGRRPAAAQAAGVNSEDLLDQILYAEPEFDEDQVDFVWNDLIATMLEKDARDRATLSDIKRHPAVSGAPGSRSVSSAASELDPSGLTPRDFGDLEGAVVERRPILGATAGSTSPTLPKPAAIDMPAADGSMNLGSCLASPVQRLPAHQRLARFRLGVAGKALGDQPVPLTLPQPAFD